MVAINITVKIIRFALSEKKASTEMKAQPKFS
jgi:hypothetical protein